MNPKNVIKALLVVGFLLGAIVWLSGRGASHAADNLATGPVANYSDGDYVGSEACKDVSHRQTGTLRV